MTASSKILDDPEFGPVVLRKHARARRITLRLSSDGRVRISLPFRTSYIEAVAFFSRNREWIRKALVRQQARREAAGPAPAPPSGEDIQRLRALAKETLPALPQGKHQPEPFPRPFAGRTARLCAPPRALPSAPSGPFSGLPCPAGRVVSRASGPPAGAAPIQAGLTVPAVTSGAKQKCKIFLIL